MEEFLLVIVGMEGLFNLFYMYIGIYRQQMGKKIFRNTL